MGQDFCERALEFPTLIAGVGEQRLQEGIHSEQCRQQQDAAVAILDVGRMNDRVQQQTQRVYQNVALLALDLLARIIAMRIDAGPPCMGPFLSSGFGAAHLSFLIGFFVRPGGPFLRPDPQYCKASARRSRQGWPSRQPRDMHRPCQATP
jgi:hypothetical protein